MRGPRHEVSADRAIEKRHLFLLCLCFFVSGAGSLMLEVVWTRQLRLVFGSSTLATSTILVAYMLGLGLGALAAGRIGVRRLGGIHAYAVLEMGIALYALAVPTLLELLPALVRGTLGQLPFWPMALARFGLALAVLVVPTVLMGATLPLLVGATVGEGEETAKRAGLLYGANTLGAVTGVVLAAFLLLPWLGLSSTNLVGAGLDAGVGLFAFGLVAVGLLPAVPASVAGTRLAGASAERATADNGASGPPVTDADAPARRARARRSPPPVPDGRGRLPILFAYGVVGFSALVYEVAWSRVLGMVMGSSTYAFATMLAAFLIGIALGSLAIRPWVGRPASPEAVLGLGVAGLGVLALGTMIAMPRLPDLYLAIVWQLGLANSALVATHVLVALALLLPPTIVLGMLFPLAAQALGRRSAGAERAIGDLYFANTVGSALGAFAAGFVLIPLLGIRRLLGLVSGVDLLVGAALLASGFAVAGAAKGGRENRVTLAVVLAFLGLLAVLRPPAWDANSLTRGLFRGTEDAFDAGIELEPLEGVAGPQVLHYRDGASTTVSVHRIRSHTTLRVNGKADASTGVDVGTQILLGQIPLLFGSPARTVMVIGFASGMTVGSVATHPVERIDAVDLEADMREASHFFDAWNGRPLEDPRVHFIVDDGRAHLAAGAGPYDVIVSEPSNPWVAGVGNLFTREFFQLAHRSLTPSGRLFQWVQLYGMEPSTVQSIIAAMRGEFAHLYGFAPRRGFADLLVMATDEPLTIDHLPRWEDQPTAVRRDLERIGNYSTTDLWSLLRLLPQDLDELAREAEQTSTDDNLLVETRTPWDLRADTVGANWAEIDRFPGGIVPLIEGSGRLDGPLANDLLYSYAARRIDTPVVGGLVGRAIQLGLTARGKAAGVALQVAAGDDDDETPPDPADLERVERAIELDPGDPEVRFLRARLRARAGDRTGALADLDVVLRAQPANDRARGLRAWTLQTVDRSPEAVPDLELLRSGLHPFAVSDFFKDAGVIYLDADRPEEGVEMLELALEREPGWLDGWKLLAIGSRTLGRRSEVERATRNLERAERNTPKLLHRQARIALWSGAPASAVALLRVVVNTDPTNETARAELAALERSGLVPGPVAAVPATVGSPAP